MNLEKQPETSGSENRDDAEAKAEASST